MLKSVSSILLLFVFISASHAILPDIAKDSGNITNPDEPDNGTREDDQYVRDMIKKLEEQVNKLKDDHEIVLNIIDFLSSFNQSQDVEEQETENVPPEDVDLAIRLIGGNSSSQGRLEIHDDGVREDEDESSSQYNTVCDKSFSFADAKVICRMLGFGGSDPDVIVGAHFGEGSGGKVYAGFGCLGNETNFRQCPDVFEQDDCPHSHDVSIDCEPPAMDGVSRNKITGVRLGGQPNSQTSGRLEVQMNGRVWGTVCDNLFNAKNAEVACRNMNLLKGVKPTLTRNYDGSDRPGSILLDGLRCEGKEAKLEDCKHKPLGHHRCHHYEDVGIDCQPHNNKNVQVSCPPQYEHISDFCFSHEPEPHNYIESQIICREKDNGFIAEARSEEEKNHILQIMRYNNAHIVWLARKSGACVVLMANGQIQERSCMEEIPVICQKLGTVSKP